MKLPRAYHLSAKELAGQLLMPAVHVNFAARSNQKLYQTIKMIQNFSIGGIILFGGHPVDVCYVIEKLQAASKYPLLIAADLERGTGGLFLHGTKFPHLLAWGAADKKSIITKVAGVIASEAKAIGINTILAPVLDLVNEPDNPIINIRGYHSDSSIVAEFGKNFISRLQDDKIAGVAKHFPGHGRSCSDSHLKLPKVGTSLAELEKSDLIPFKEAINCGVKGIMSAHIQFDSHQLPATFRTDILYMYLRKKLGFNGVLFTDALNMRSITRNIPLDQQVTLGLQCGIDIFLLPQRLPLFFNHLSNLLQKVPHLRQKAEESVERIFSLKKWITTGKQPISNQKRIYKFIENPISLRLSSSLAEKSITCVHQTAGFPFDLTTITRCLHIIHTDFKISEEPLLDFRAALEELFEEVITKINPTIKKIQHSTVILQTDLIIFSIYSRTFGGHQSKFKWKEINQIFDILVAKNQRIAIVFFGNPFHIRYLSSWKNAATVFLVFSYVKSSQIALFKALASFTAIEGKMPTTIDTQEGIVTATVIAKRKYRLDQTLLVTGKFFEVGLLIEKAIGNKVFPGAVLLVALNQKIIYWHGFGFYDYDSKLKNTEIKPETEYDLASMTKILATTPLILKLIEQKYLNIDEPLKRFYPTLQHQPLGKAKISDLLTHQAGLAKWKPFYINYSTKSEIVDAILNLDLDYKIGTKSIYSDLGFILLADIIEKVTGSNFVDLGNNLLFNPMGIKSLKFKPHLNEKDRRLFSVGNSQLKYPPSGFDPFRNRIIMGEVNDTNCYVMGGISGHAGLFGNAKDVAAIGQLFLNGGIYNNRRFLKINTVKKSIQRYNPNISNRALGWDTISKNNSSTGKYFSQSSFGHLAFTGPSIWVDPTKKLVVVFLCNRTHPDPQNNKIKEFRPVLHNLIFEALKKTGADLTI